MNEKTTNHKELINTHNKFVVVGAYEVYVPPPPSSEKTAEIFELSSLLPLAFTSHTRVERIFGISLLLQQQQKYPGKFFLAAVQKRTILLITRTGGKLPPDIQN